jgi:hypothetical protein
VLPHLREDGDRGQTRDDTVPTTTTILKNSIGPSALTHALMINTRSEAGSTPEIADPGRKDLPHWAERLASIGR